MASALNGIRVLDVTHVWAGPLAGRMLADLGAEVIHIQSRALVDGSPVDKEEAAFFGTFPDNDPGERPWERQALTNDLNRNKRGLTLELNTPSGLALFKRLVSVSDVVLENFSPRVMENFGITYSVLQRLNPRIIMCSLSGFGLTGPFRDHVAFGTTIEPACGLAGITGYPGGGPRLSGNPYPDAVAAMHGTVAVLTALLHRSKSGVGQQIDLSQCESATCLIGEYVLDLAINHRLPERMGNHDCCCAPYGCYPCRGEDKWITIEITGEPQWQALVESMGNPPWAGEERFSHMNARLENREELDRRVADWTSGYPSHELMLLLQEHGIPAGDVLNAEELMNDPHLLARGFFQPVFHPETGRRLYAGSAIHFEHDSSQKGSPAPTLGRDNEWVLKEILGLSDAEIGRLYREGVIGCEPIQA
ncbi:MAG: CoA transferase [Desulfobacterales bacterium]